MRISIPVADLVPHGVRADASSFTTLSYAVKAVAEAAHGQWVAYAMGQPLPSGQTINARGGTYARSIQMRQTGDFSAEVYSNLPYADGVERGFPQWDMKEMLTRSLKVRMVTDPRSPNFGKRYLIIPFRWAAQGKGGVGNNVVPQAVSNWWQTKTTSRVVRMGERRSGAGMMAGGRHIPVHDVRTRDPLHVPQRVYDWGDKLKKSDLSRMGIRGAGARRQMAGMVKFDKPGGGGHSQLLTFRTMMEGSSGWIRKAKPGKYPARAVAQQMEPVAEQAFRRAVEEDVARILGAALRKR